MTDGRTRTWGENAAAMASNVVLVLLVAVAGCLGGDINRQSIVFHEETPEVFYCPQVRVNEKLHEHTINAKSYFKLYPLEKFCND